MECWTGTAKTLVIRRNPIQDFVDKKMNVQQAYNLWAEQYDTNVNKTRDLEGIALRKTLEHIPFHIVSKSAAAPGKIQNGCWHAPKILQP